MLWLYGTLVFLSAPRDPLFELLIKLVGVDAIPFIEALSLRDPINDRPLFWLAKVLLDEGKLEKAEQLARKAVYLAPSPRHRMKGHAILAEILIRQGKPDEVAIYNGMVEAIRLAEEADKMHKLGLLNDAIEHYQRAVQASDRIHETHLNLGKFLTITGSLEKAAVHFTKAIELLPDSIDFDTTSYAFPHTLMKELQGVPSIGEVLTKLVQNGDQLPATYFLLGTWQLKECQQVEAFANFHKAVDLEPDFLPAWDHIVQLEHKMGKPMRTSAQALLRLDPSNEKILLLNDYKLLWELSIEAISRIRKNQIELYAWSYPIDPNRDKPKTNIESDLDDFRQMGRKVTRETPADVLLSNRQINDICKFISIANWVERN